MITEFGACNIKHYLTPIKQFSDETLERRKFLLDGRELEIVSFFKGDISSHVFTIRDESDEPDMIDHGYISSSLAEINQKFLEYARDMMDEFQQ